ncbi:hypothetical protein F1C16_22300 (plasmid) [Hymenobacter sp. NBH84]|uniref:hypothetical protein n=1 Tax=Hymenobacter sp. NBH84 TaxID=2596915 RepID=UPI001626500C|nr:hypothetical protein [Hymenobacter sp. NBH84]QNE42355.1 hypothetical protein F1C16_22300 [Hymenobacter sp. NBH84]
MSYDFDNMWLSVEWRGHQEPGTIQADCELILHYLMEHDGHKLLCDGSDARDGWDGIERWVGQQYFPRLAQAGVQAVAWINPTDLVSKAEILTIVRYATTPYVSVFDCGAQACDWLRQTHLAAYE